MLFNKVSVFAVICSIGSVQGSGDGCPGDKADSRCEITCRSPSRCYELEGSFICCNETGSSGEGEYGNVYVNILDNQDHQEPDPSKYNDSILGRKDTDNYADIVDVGLDVTEITIIIEILMVLVAFIICCSCSRALCSLYYCWRHPNSTNVTVVQPAGAGGTIVQNNIYVSVPTQPAMQQPCAMMPVQQAPSAYDPGYGQQYPVPAQIYQGLPIMQPSLKRNDVQSRDEHVATSAPSYWNFIAN